MIKVENFLIPFRGYKAITLWPFIFIREGCPFYQVDENHEKIHGRQQLEMLIIPFYLWYLIEWVIRLFLPGRAYKNISFEREASENEGNTSYLKHRKFWSFIKYL